MCSVAQAAQLLCAAVVRAVCCSRSTPAALPPARALPPADASGVSALVLTDAVSGVPASVLAAVLSAAHAALAMLLQRPITVNFGMQMPGWYDIASLEDINAREDKEGLHESQRCVLLLLLMLRLRLLLGACAFFGGGVVGGSHSVARRSQLLASMPSHSLSC